MNGQDLHATLFEGLATYEEVAAAVKKSPRAIRRHVLELGVRVVYFGKTPYLDVNDYKAKSRGERPRRGRPRKVA